MQLAHRLRMVEHDLRDVRPALQVAAPLELEQVALGSEHGAGGKTVGEPGHRAIASRTSS
jgi:hypothetical protein